MYTARLAEIYDKIYQFKDYESESRYIIEKIDAHAPSADSILETACGTGRYLGFVLPRFREAAGLDISREMLEQARQLFPNVPFYEADVACFELGQKFDVVSCLFRSIGYVKTTARLRSAIRSMAAHLTDGGVILVEPFFTPDTYWVDRITLNEYKTEDAAISWMYVSERYGDVARMDIHYLVGTGDGVEHFSEVHEFGLFARADFDEAFADANMNVVYDAVGPSGVGLYIAKHK